MSVPVEDTLELVSLRGRDDLVDQILAPAIHGLWPTFMHDQIGRASCRERV